MFGVAQNPLKAMFTQICHNSLTPVLMEGRVMLRSLQKASRALQQKQQQQTVKWPHTAQA